MISILVASRGLVFCQVDQGIDQIRDRFDSCVIRTYDKKIPDAQNYLVEEALKTSAESFLFVEEDTVPPYEGILEMVRADVDIAFIDYAVNGWSCCAKDKNKEVLWCGLGCTLIKRCVFEKVEKPYFRTDKTLRLNDWVWTDVLAKYGGQDIWFFTQARKAGFKITQIGGECDHLGIKALGRAEVNNGLHTLYVKDRIKNFQTI